MLPILHHNPSQEPLSWNGLNKYNINNPYDALIDFGPYLPRELVPEFLEATKDLNEEHGTLIFASIAQHIPSEKLTDLVYLLTCLPWNGAVRIQVLWKSL